MKLSSLLLVLAVSSSSVDARLRGEEDRRHHHRQLKKEKKKGGGKDQQKKEASDEKSGANANRNYYTNASPQQTTQGVTNNAGSTNNVGITNYVPSTTAQSTFYQGQPQVAGAQYAYGYDAQNGQYHPGLDPNTGQLNQYARLSRDPGNNGYGGTPPCAGTRGGCYSQTGAYYPNGVPAQQQQMPATKEQAVINRAGAGYENASATKISTFDAGTGGQINVWKVRPAGMEPDEEEIVIDNNRAEATSTNDPISPPSPPAKSNIPTWPYTSYPYVALPPFSQQCEAHEQCQSGCCVLNIVGTCMDAGRCA